MCVKFGDGRHCHNSGALQPGDPGGRPVLFLGGLDFVAEAFDALAVGEADFCLVEGFDAEPLTVAPAVQDVALGPGAQERVLDESVLIYFHDAVADFGGEEQADDGGLVGKGFDEDVDEKDLRQEGWDVIANEGKQGEEGDFAVAGVVVQGDAGLEIDEVKEAVQPYGDKKTDEGDNDLLPALSRIADIAERRAETGGEG